MEEKLRWFLKLSSQTEDYKILRLEKNLLVCNKYQVHQLDHRLRRLITDQRFVNHIKHKLKKWDISFSAPENLNLQPQDDLKRSPNQIQWLILLIKIFTNHQLKNKFSNRMEKFT
jgi:hypothetical protein